MKIESRGYRNNNPGNIRISKELWLGEVRPSSDSQFKQFSDMSHGFRAMFKLLRNYSLHYSCRTLSDMIARWAPENENDTERYVSFVSAKSYVDKTSKINTLDKDIMTALVSAMAHYENGSRPTQQDVDSGWALFISEL